MRFLSPWLVLLCLGSLFVACGGKPQSTVGGVCTSASDCVSSLTCVATKCCVPSGGGCKLNSDCCLNYCSTGTCCLPKFAACASSADCCSGLRCGTTGAFAGSCCQIGVDC